MQQYLRVSLASYVLCALCACGAQTHVVSLTRCGRVELLNVRYDSTLGDSMCRVILDGMAFDTNGVLQPVEYWYRTVFDFPATMFDERTARLLPGMIDTVVIPSVIYKLSFRIGTNPDRSVHSNDLVFYHSHEYRIRAYIEPRCEKLRVLP